MTRRALALKVAFLSFAWPLATNAQEAPVWHIESYTGCEIESDRLALQFSTPLANPVPFQATCVIDGGVPAVDLDFDTQIDGFATGARVNFRVFAQDFSWQADAQVLRLDPALSGVRVRVSLDDPIWQAFATRAHVIYGVAQRQSQPLRIGSAAPLFTRFVQACQEWSDGRPQIFRAETEALGASALVESDGECGLWIRLN